MAHYLVMHPPDLCYTLELNRAIGQMMFALERHPWDYATAEQKATGITSPISLRSFMVHEAHITMLNVSLTCP